MAEAEAAAATLDSGRYERWGYRLGTLLVAPTLLILAAAGIYAVGDAVLAPTPIPKSPGFIDTVLASRAVVAAVRLAIIFAAVYIVVSAVWLVANRRFLVQVGPVKVSEEVSDLDTENRRLWDDLQAASETIEDLQDELAATNEVLAIMQTQEFGDNK